MRKMKKGLGRTALVGIAVVILVIAASGAVFFFTPGQTISTTSQTVLNSSVSVSNTGQQGSSTTGSSTSTSQSTVSSSSTKSVTVVTLKLVAGTASNATYQGTAHLSVVLNNPGATTNISSIQIFRPPTVARPPIFQCSSSTSCLLISSPLVLGNANTNFTTPTTEFFIGVNIVSGSLYGYEIYFPSGFPIAATINATAS